MSKLLRSTLLLLFLLTAAKLSAGEVLTICGTGDSQPLLRELAAVYEELHPGATIAVPESIGSTGGIRATAREDCQLGRVARPLRPEERQFDLRYRLFAYSPVVFAANLPKTCLSSLSSDQLVAIYQGRITNWADLGPCPDHKIYVANREAGDSSRSVLEAGLPGFAGIGAPAGKTLYSTPDILRILREHPYTIGYLPLATVKKMRLQVFAINGKAPTSTALRQGDYKLFIPMGLVWKGRLTGLARKFTNFLSSRRATHIMWAAGAIPASVFKPGELAAPR